MRSSRIDYSLSPNPGPNVYLSTPAYDALMQSRARHARILVVIKDSKTCRDAEMYLRSLGLTFEVADAQELGILASLRRDLGVNTLPALVTSSGTFEGLEEIRSELAQHGKK